MSALHLQMGGPATKKDIMPFPELYSLIDDLINQNPSGANLADQLYFKVS